MPCPGYEEVVLLTGFPSFFARRLLLHILGAEPHALVYAVVRPAAAEEAEQALLQLEAKDRERVILLEGDAAAVDMGLSGAEIRLLATQVDRIHHAAFASYHGLDRHEVERLNVGGVGEVLEVAAACEMLRCLVLHSTVQIAGDRKGLVREDELEVGQKFPTLIAETRARGEKLARKAMSRIPIAVVRAASIVGDSQTGEIDRFDGPYLYILLIATSPADFAVPLPGRGDVPLHVVPVDYVAKAAHAIGRSPNAPGRTFHVVDPNPLPAKRAFELVAQACGRPMPRGSFPTNLARALLRTPGLERFATSPRAFVEQLATDVRFDTSNTDSVLASAPIQCPPFESYVNALVGYVQDRVRERREHSATRSQSASDAGPPSPPSDSSLPADDIPSHS